MLQLAELVLNNDLSKIGIMSMDKFLIEIHIILFSVFYNLADCEFGSKGWPEFEYEYLPNFRISRKMFLVVLVYLRLSLMPVCLQSSF